MISEDLCSPYMYEHNWTEIHLVWIINLCEDIYQG
jgi:hypothetical protein